MAQPQTSRFIDFSGGLQADVNRFMQPPGTIPRVSNLVYMERGALRTINGSRILSSLNGLGATTGQPPFRAIKVFTPSVGAAKTLALQVSGSQILLIDVTNASYSGNITTWATTYNVPGMVQFADKMAFALGNNFAPQLYDGTTITQINNNTWTAAGFIPFWLGNTAYALGQAVVPNPSNGHVYIAVKVSGDGLSAAGAPAFPTAVNGTIVDKNVTWMEVGPSSPASPPGAAFLFSHQNFLWAWGTNPTYTANGLDGPDALRMSDLGNPNSWNVLNATFVGKGDGELPTGGAVFTLSEAGIAATAQLVLFKSKSTYVALGAFGAPNFTITKVPTDMGNAAPKSSQFLAGLGLMRLTHKGFALFNGQNDDVGTYTDPIRGYLFGGHADISQIDWSNVALSQSSQTADPPTYVCYCPIQGALTRAFMYDLDRQAWTVIDLPWAIGTAAYEPSLTAVSVLSLVGGVGDGTIRRVFDRRDQDWDGTPINFLLRTPQVGLADAPIFLRRLRLRAEPSSPAVFGITPPQLNSAILNYVNRDGVATSLTVLPKGTPKPILNTLEIGVTMLGGNLDINGQGAAIIEGVAIDGVPRPASRIQGPPPQNTPQGAVWGQVTVYQQFGTQSVNAAASTVSVVFNTNAPNASYQVVGLVPSWNTTVSIPAGNKLTTGFTMQFSVACPAGGGSIDWQAIE